MTVTNEKPAIDARLVNPLVAATLDVLGTMAGTEATLKEVIAQKDYQANGDISAIIGIVGEDGEGMIGLSFSLNLANLLVSRLLGIAPNAVNSEERCDGIGEIVNMISGQTKAALSQLGNNPYKLTLPSIILGSGHEIATRPRNNPYLFLVFEAEGHTFHVQLTFKFRD